MLNRIPFHVRAVAAISAALMGTRVGSAFDAFVLNRYEAAQRWSNKRTYLPGYVQDPRQDITQCTRLELVRKSRYFEKNNALANRLAELFTEFAVGVNGPPITPASSDDEWNQRAAEWLGEWSPVADLTTLQGYGGLMTTAAWRRFFDGEFFILKTGEGGRPRLQGISAHRVGTPGEYFDQEGKTIIDGVKIDSRGRPIGYYIQEGIEADDYTFRSANQVIHIFEPESPGQYRGLPLLTPVLNDLHDLDDLEMFVMQIAKDAASVTNILKSPSGESNPQNLRSSRYLQTTQKSDGTEIQESRVQFFKQILGPRTIGLKPDEVLEQLRSERPGPAEQWYWHYLTSKICGGVGISKLLAYPSSIQGTVARADLDLAHNYFRARFAPFQSAAFQIYLFAIGSARFSDPRVADAPANWTKVNIRPPRAVNVDVGRNSAAMIAELESGATTLEEIYGSRGMDWREQVRQRGREESFIDQVATEFKLTPDRIRRAIGDSLKNDMDKASERQQQEDLQPA